MIAFFRSTGVWVGFADRTNPARPDTCGAAIDVPSIVKYVPPGRVLMMSTPGAATSTDVRPQFENTHCCGEPHSLL